MQRAKRVTVHATLEFLHRLQARTAQLSIARSTLRNQGQAGMVESARKYLTTMDLCKVRASSRAKFDSVLDAHTLSLMQCFPVGGRTNWGAARKSLNIFLRDVVYNRFLCTHFRLSRLEPWLELPLDSYSYDGIAREAENGAIPNWPRIKHLSPKISATLQASASEIALRLGVPRVHLDVMFCRLPLIDET